MDENAMMCATFGRAWLLCLCLFLFTVNVNGQFEQQFFKEREGYDKTYGIQAVDTLSNGLIVFQRAQPEEVMEIEAFGSKNTDKTSSAVYYAYQYNIGRSKNKLLLADWARSIDSLLDPYLLIRDDSYKLFNVKKNKINELKTISKPLLYHNFLVVEEFVPRNDPFSFGGKEPAPYVVYDLATALTEVDRDTFTTAVVYQNYLYLQNSRELGKSRLLNSALEPVLPAGINPETIYGDVVLVSDASLKHLGLANLKGEVLIPLVYQKIDMGPLKHLFLYEGNGTGFGYPFGKQLITAFRNDSAFLYNQAFQLIYADKNFSYRILEKREHQPYIEIEQNRRKGLLDTNGKVIVPVINKSLTLEKYYITVRQDSYEEEEIYSYDGKKLFSGPYRHIYDLPGSSLVVLNAEKGSGSTPAKVWLADTKTNTILTPEPFNHYWGYSEGIVEFSNDDQHYFYDLNGNLLFKFQADEVTDFTDGEAFVIRGRKVGKINTKGELIEKFHKE